MEFKQNSVKFEGKFRDFAIFPMKMLVKKCIICQIRSKNGFFEALKRSRNRFFDNQIRSKNRFFDNSQNI